MVYFGDAYQGTPAIAARGEGLRTPNAKLIKRDRLSPNRKGEWSTPSHLFLCELPNGDGAYLPESKVEKEFVGNTGNLYLEQLFTKGDVLWLLEAHEEVTFAGVTKGATITFEATGAGYTTSYTWDAALGTSISRLALDVQTFLNKDPYFSSRVSTVVRGETLYLFATQSFNRLNLIITPSVGTVTTVPVSTGAPFNPFTPVLQIGTITSIDRSGQITLAEPVPFVIPKGANVGVLVNRVIGYHPHPVNWANKNAAVLTAIEQATIRVMDMPYYRPGLSYWLPGIVPDLSYKPTFN